MFQVSFLIVLILWPLPRKKIDSRGCSPFGLKEIFNKQKSLFAPEVGFTLKTFSFLFSHFCNLSLPMFVMYELQMLKVIHQR